MKISCKHLTYWKALNNPKNILIDKIHQNVTYTVEPPRSGVDGEKSQNVLATSIASCGLIGTTDAHQHRFNTAILVRAQHLHLLDVVGQEVTVAAS